MYMNDLRQNIRLTDHILGRNSTSMFIFFKPPKISERKEKWLPSSDNIVKPVKYLSFLVSTERKCNLPFSFNIICFRCNNNN